MTTAEFVSTRTIRGVRWVEFARSPVDAFVRPMVEQTRDTIRQAVVDDTVRVVVLASAVDGYSSAGADLNEFRGMGSTDMRGWVRLCHEIATLLRTAPKPVLTSIHGTAVGGVLEMALHADLRFAATDVRLGQPEIQIAFIPPIATTQALVRLIGRPRTLRYLYEGRLVDDEEALEWGLVDEVVDPAALRTHVQDVADSLASRSAPALATIRRTVTLGGGLTFADGMQLELEEATALADTADFAEGIDAFLTKRAPSWRHR